MTHYRRFKIDPPPGPASWRGPDKPAASTNSMSRFETEVLARPENLEGLARMNAQGGSGYGPHLTGV